MKRMIIILTNKYAATERCIISADRHNEILDYEKSAQWKFCGKSSASIFLLDFYLTTIKDNMYNSLHKMHRKKDQ